MPRDEWLRATRRDIARRAWMHQAPEKEYRPDYNVSPAPAKPKKKREATKTKSQRRRARRARQHESQMQTLPSGRKRIGRSIWFLPPPYNFTHHPVPSPEEMRAMFG